VPNQKKYWFVANVRTQYERACRDQLLKLGFEAYVASQTEMHQYSCRKKRLVENVVISSRVFIHATEAERLEAQKQCPLIYHYMIDKAGTPNDYGRAPYAIIPDDEMQRLQYMLYHADTPVLFTTDKLRAGDNVRVLRGPLKGYQGQIMRSGTNTYVVATLEALGNAMVAINPADLEKI